MSKATGNIRAGIRLIIPTSVCMPLTSWRTSSHMTDACRSGSTLSGSSIGKVESLDRGFSSLFGSDPNGLVDRNHKHLSVSDLPSSSSLNDCFYCSLDPIVGHHNLKFHFTYEINVIFTAPIDFRITLFP